MRSSAYIYGMALCHENVTLVCIIVTRPTMLPKSRNLAGGPGEDSSAIGVHKGCAGCAWTHSNHPVWPRFLLLIFHQSPPTGLLKKIVKIIIKIKY